MNIETERTIIRYFRNTDHEDLYRYLSLPETYEYEPGSPITLEEAKQIADDRVKGTNFIAVINKLNNKLIGHFSFFQIEPRYINTYELGFIFNPEYQGQGFATESGKAFIEHCFCDASIHRIISNCNPNNHKSWKLLEHLGFEREGHLRKNIYFKKKSGKPIWLDTFVYGIINPKESL